MIDIKQEQGSRFAETLNLLKLNQREFANKISVSQPYISLLVRAEKALSGAIITRIAETFPAINLNWLINGRGAPMDDKQALYTRETKNGEPPVMVAEIPQILCDLQKDVQEFRERILAIEIQTGIREQVDETEN